MRRTVTFTETRPSHQYHIVVVYGMVLAAYDENKRTTAEHHADRYNHDYPHGDRATVQTVVRSFRPNIGEKA